MKDETKFEDVINLDNITGDLDELAGLILKHFKSGDFREDDYGAPTHYRILVNHFEISIHYIEWLWDLLCVYIYDELPKKNGRNHGKRISIGFYDAGYDALFNDNQKKKIEEILVPKLKEQYRNKKNVGKNERTGIVRNMILRVTKGDGKA